MISKSFYGSSYTTNIALGPWGLGGTVTGYAQQRYVTSSGEVYWVFLLRDRISGDIASAYEAPDHPCFGNGGKPGLVPHPFVNYDAEKFEITVITPSPEQVEEIDARRDSNNDTIPDRSRLEVILEDYDIDDNAEGLEWPSIPVTVGLPKGYDWQAAAALGEPVEPIKMVIPKPDHIRLAALKLKTNN
jgi:hypothetical protein